MDLTATKAVALVVLGLIKLVSGLAPLVVTKLLKKKSDRFLKKFIGVTLCFGGGVLLATVLLHMLKEVREVLEQAAGKGALPESLEEYPFAELMVGAGFLLILLIESVVHKFFGGHGHTHFPSQETLAKKFVAVEDMRRGVDNVGYDTESHGSVPHVYSVTGAGLSSASNSDSEASPPASPEHRAEADKKGDILGSLRSILTVMALSVHSLFEGMAIGLDETQSGVWLLTGAISLHAVPIVFCIGTDMLTSGVKKMKLIVYMIILSLNTPIGILIGIIVTLHKDENDDSGGHILAIGILQGLAAGTLLYITFFEVLARDKLTKYGMSGLAGALAVILGFAFMGGMEAIGPGHSHDIGHGHAHHHGHDLHHEALSQAEGHLHMAHEQHHHDHEDHDDHDHLEYDPDHHDHELHDDHEHDLHDVHDHELHDDHDHDEHDHYHEDSHEHEEEHSHEEHDHEHDHHDNDDDDIDADLIRIKPDDYFELNGTDSKFMHDM